jgi:hypothetical protein
VNGTPIDRRVSSGKPGEEKVTEMLKVKSRGKALLGKSVELNDKFVYKIVPKSDEDKKFIREGLSKSFIFAALDESELNYLVDAMEKQVC